MCESVCIYNLNRRIEEENVSNVWRCLFNLGYWKHSTSKSLQQQIVVSLRLGDRSKASSLLSQLGHTDTGELPLIAEDFHFILQYCARLPDPLVTLTRNFFLLFTVSFLLFIKCYTANLLCRWFHDLSIYS